MKVHPLIHFSFFTAAIVGIATAFPQRIVPLSFEDAQPVLSTLEDKLPDELRSSAPGDRSASWSRWLTDYGAKTAQRLAKGDEDTFVNFLLYGTSFTRQRRVRPSDFASKQASNGEKQGLGEKPDEIIRNRIQDLVSASSSPGDNERLRYLHAFFEDKGHDVSTPRGRAEAMSYLVDCLIRVMQESKQYAEEIQSVRQAGDSTAEFEQRSTLFSARGISLDTSVLPGFAIEESLKAMKNRGLLAAGGIRRAAVIGPGLDFIDKDAGYDLYPPQTIQPFALMDSLVRLGLSDPEKLEIAALDVSQRVIDHLARARQRAAAGSPYTLHLVRDSRRPWKAESVGYWKAFGDQIGRGLPTPPLSLNTPGLEVRVVRVRPNLVARIRPMALNMVTQHIDLAESERFDLIIATNVFVYYGVFEQSLALANIEHMLRRGGFLLSNNLLLELPLSEIHSVDYHTVVYSDRNGDGDHIVWYQKGRSQKPEARIQNPEARRKT